MRRLPCRSVVEVLLRIMISSRGISSNGQYGAAVGKVGIYESPILTFADNTGLLG